jgi:hypothetical protein
MSVDPAAALHCRFCGRAPAIAATVRAHRGMIIVMQWRSLRGPYCRSCGMQVLKKLTGETLWQGWWGVVSAVLGTPFTLISNFITWLRIRALPEPIGDVAVQPAPAAPPSALYPPPPPPLPPAPTSADSS